MLKSKLLGAKKLILRFIQKNCILIVILLLFFGDFGNPFPSLPFDPSIIKLILIFVLLFTRYSPKQLGLTLERKDLKYLLIGLFFVVSLIILKICFSTPPYFDFSNILEIISEGWVIAFLIPPIFEEISYRVVLFTPIKDVSKGWVAILITALLWGMGHGGWIPVVGITGIGILWGAFRNDGAPIYVMMICHFLNNLFEVSLSAHNIMVDMNLTFLSLVILIVGTHLAVLYLTGLLSFKNLNKGLKNRSKA